MKHNITASKCIETILSASGTVATAVRAYCGATSEKMVEAPKAARGRLITPNADGGHTVCTIKQSDLTAAKVDMLASDEYKALGKKEAATVRGAFRDIAERHDLYNTRDGKAPTPRAVKAPKAEKETPKNPELETTSGIKEMSIEQLYANIETITRSWFKAHGGSKREITTTLRSAIDTAING